MSEGFNPDKLFSDIDAILKSQGIDTSSFENQGPLVMPESLKEMFEGTSSTTPSVSQTAASQASASQSSASAAIDSSSKKQETASQNTNNTSYKAAEQQTAAPLNNTNYVQQQLAKKEAEQNNAEQKAAEEKRLAEQKAEEQRLAEQKAAEQKAAEQKIEAKKSSEQKSEANEDNPSPINHAEVPPANSSKFTTIDSPKEWEMELVLEPAAPELGVYEPADKKPPVNYINNIKPEEDGKINLATGEISLGVETESIEYDEGHPVLRFFRNLIICALLALILAFVITKYVAHHTQVDGTSMEETLKDGDELIVEQVSYYFHDPERYDVIVFPTSTHNSYIKRIIGLPGETVQIMDGKVYINGNMLTESYGRDPIEDPGLAADPIYLAGDEYFVLGDNRNASVDSRSSEVGLIKKDKIIGKAWLRFYPISTFSLIE